MVTARTTPSRGRLRRRAVIAIAAIAATTSACTERGEPTPTAFDPDAPGPLDGLVNGIATIEGTVVGTLGYDIETYLTSGLPNDASTDDWPRIVVGEIVFVGDGERGPEYDKYVADVRSAADDGHTLALLISNGYYEVGRRYTLVLGGTGAGYSAMFGYDVADRRPVEGFDGEDARAQLAVLLEGADPTDPSAAIAAVVAEINRAAVGGGSTEPSPSTGSEG